MSSIKNLAKHTAIYGIPSIVGRILNYFLVPLYTHFFLTHEYGVVTLLYSYASFLAVLLTYGMETGFFRFSQDKDKYDVVYNTSLISISVTTLLFLIIIFLFYDKIAIEINLTKNNEYIIYFALICGFDALTAIPFANLRRLNRPIKFMVFKSINIGLQIFFNLFFLLLCPYLLEKFPGLFLLKFYNHEFALGYIFISNLIASSITLLLFIPDYFKIKWKIDYSTLKMLIIYSMPLLIVGLAGMVNETGDRIMLNKLLKIPAGINDIYKYTMSQVGIYGANYKLAILMTLFVQAFRYASEPVYFAQISNPDGKNFISKAMTYFIIFGLTIFLGVMLFIDVVKYFINYKYWDGLNVVPVLLLANLFLGISINLSIWYKLLNKTSYGAYIALIGAIITIIFNILLVPIFGYTGAAWATFICYGSMMVISYLLGQKFYKINYEVKKLGIYLLLTLILYSISYYIKDYNSYLKYLFNTFLFFLFCFIIVIREKLHKRFYLFYTANIKKKL
jgi:O-antigen/teichoic acid export membrane protein